MRLMPPIIQGPIKQGGVKEVVKVTKEDIVAIAEAAEEGAETVAPIGRVTQMHNGLMGLMVGPLKYTHHIISLPICGTCFHQIK